MNEQELLQIIQSGELSHLLQSNGGSLYADELLVQGSSIDDIDLKQFELFISRKYKKSLEDLNIDTERIF
jgi:hypothetical protein